MGEEFAVKGVECRDGMLRDGNLGLQDSLDEGVSSGAMEFLDDPAKAVDHAGDPGVGDAQERQSRLDGAEACVGEMLACPGRMLEPAVVGQRHQQLCPEGGRSPCLIS